MSRLIYQKEFYNNNALRRIVLFKRWCYYYIVKKLSRYFLFSKFNLSFFNHLLYQYLPTDNGRGFLQHQDINKTVMPVKF